MVVKGINRVQVILAILWVLFLGLDIWLSLSPGVRPPYEFEQSDKFYHMVMYFLLSFLPFVYSINITKATFISLVSLLIGIILECIQFFVPFREFSIMDICANELGVLLGIIVGIRMRRYLFGKGIIYVLSSSLF